METFWPAGAVSDFPAELPLEGNRFWRFTVTRSPWLTISVGPGYWARAVPSE